MFIKILLFFFSLIKFYSNFFCKSLEINRLVICSKLLGIERHVIRRERLSKNERGDIRLMLTKIDPNNRELVSYINDKDLTDLRVDTQCFMS